MTQDPANFVIPRSARTAVLSILSANPKRDPGELKEEQDAAVAMLVSLDPRDDVQVALAIRAVITHHLSVECFRKATRPGTDPGDMGGWLTKGMALSRLSLQLTNQLGRTRAASQAAAAADPVAPRPAAAPAAPAAGTAPAAGAPPAPAPRPVPAAHAGGVKLPLPRNAPAQRPGSVAAALKAGTTLSRDFATARETIAAVAGLSLPPSPRHAG
jgi:hypothetical protein